jgi:coproporphyrinogen III oxidase-like Fe-S oxidoreductase
MPVPAKASPRGRTSLGRALDFAADHLSLYQLTIEPGTQFEILHKAGRLQVPDPEIASDMFLATQAMTAERGLSAYEISNHAAPKCRRASTIWSIGAMANMSASDPAPMVD